MILRSAVKPNSANPLVCSDLVDKQIEIRMISNTRHPDSPPDRLDIPTFTATNRPVAVTLPTKVKSEHSLPKRGHMSLPLKLESYLTVAHGAYFNILGMPSAVARPPCRCSKHDTFMRSIHEELARTIRADIRFLIEAITPL